MLRRFLVLSALVLLIFPSCQSDSGDAVTGEEVVKAAVMAMVDGAGDKATAGYSASRAAGDVIVPITLSGLVAPGLTLSGTLSSLSLTPPSVSGKIEAEFDNYAAQGCQLTGTVTDDFTVSFVLAEGTVTTGSMTVVISGELDITGVVSGTVTFNDFGLNVTGNDAEVTAGNVTFTDAQNNTKTLDFSNLF